MKRGRKLVRALVQLLAAALLVGGFFVPVGSLPLGPSISLFDVLSGALMGGAWRPARLTLLVLFAVALAFLGASVLRLLKARHESVA